MFQLYLTPKQTIAYDALEDSNVSELMYGGAKGGGKSVFFCQWAFMQCHKLIKQFKLEEVPKYPIPVGFIGRKRGVDFNKTTLETWKKIIPADCYTIRPGEKEIIIEDRVKIIYGGLDDEMNVQKFNSAEYAFVGVDQAEEIGRTDLALLKGTLRLIINNVQPDYKILLTANPAPCFLKDDYILSPKPYQRFIQALPVDNPYLDETYVNNLRDAFKHRPELVRAYVEGSWDDLEGSDTLIQHSWILKAVGAEIHVSNDKRVTSCDVARYGNDETVIYNLVDNKVMNAMMYGPKDTTVTAANIVNMAAQNKSDLIAIDADGMGGPVYDMVCQLLRDKESKVQVMEVRSGKNAMQEGQYVNARSEMWFYASKLFAEGEVSLPNDPILIGQLSAIKYSPNGSRGRFQLEKKEEAKKRLDRSPDRADALIYGLWATTKVAKKMYDIRRTDSSNFIQKKDSYGWNQSGAGVRYAI